MNTALTIGSQEQGLFARLRRTLASLPVSYVAVASDSSPQVMLIAGNGAWASRAAEAIERGCQAVIIVDPGMTRAGDVVALADLAERKGAIVEMAERFAGDATLTHHGRDLAQHLVAVSTIILTQIGAFQHPAGAALDMVRTLRALGQNVAIDRLWTSGHSVGFRGTSGTILIEGLCTAGIAAVGQRVQALGFGRTLSMTLHGDGSARPSDIRIANMKGERKLPGVYQSADRAAWRRVIATMADATPPDMSRLRHFADDVAMIGRV